MARAFSIEDGSLDKSIVSSRNVAYKDIDLTFSPKPAGDIFKKVDAAAVKQSVKNLLLTSRGEKPFNNFFGSNLNSALFGLDTEFDPEFVQNLIFDAITNHEPRARVLSVTVQLKPENNTLDATIEFQVVNTKEIVTLDVSLARVR
jgi:phage baseplate assembly protein W